MNKADCQSPNMWRIDGPAAINKTGSLNQGIAFLELVYKVRHILNTVLVVSVDGNDALVAPFQSPVYAHA